MLLPSIKKSFSKRILSLLWFKAGCILGVFAFTFLYRKTKRILTLRSFLGFLLRQKKKLACFFFAISPYTSPRRWFFLPYDTIHELTHQHTLIIRTLLLSYTKKKYIKRTMENNAKEKLCGLLVLILYSCQQKFFLIFCHYFYVVFFLNYYTI